MSDEKITRREFIKKTGSLALSIYGFGSLYGCDIEKVKKVPKSIVPHYPSLLSIAKGDNPEKLTKVAVDALGGMKKFVKKGDVVVIKPNMSWDRIPEQAANTNPYIVGTLVEMCYDAGAKKVKIFDRTCNDERKSYANSGIADAARKKGADVFFVDDNRFKEISIPYGRKLKSWSFYEDAISADVFINVPIAKHHSSSRLTLGMKNIMGIIGGNRATIHWGIHQKLVDLNTVVKIDLTVLDAYRILVNNGPQGGNLQDVKFVGQVIASQDRVAVDSYGATLFGLKGEDLEYIKIANSIGLGEIDLKKVQIKEVKI